MGYIPGKSGGKGAIDNRGKGDAKTRREEESRVREEPSIQRARESERVALRNQLGQKPWVLREFGTGKPFPEEAISVHLKTLGMTDFSGGRAGPVHDTDVAPRTTGFRLYSTLNTSSAQPLSPPHCLFFPAVSAFTDHLGRSMRTSHDTARTPAWHQRRSKRTRASQGRSVQATSMSLTPSRRASVGADIRSAGGRRGDWFNPVRHTLTWYFGAPEDNMTAGRCTVTYLARQDGLEDKQLRAADHAVLLDVLTGLARTGVAWMRM
ncbi:hypothetical protein EDB86DRAFT_1942359 [Lactarius hatsudake]|nr:hypothetical protein EDB86DRAFT_1942359 [Lactarius hatsudake]